MAYVPAPGMPGSKKQAFKPTPGMPGAPKPAKQQVKVAPNMPGSPQQNFQPTPGMPGNPNPQHKPVGNYGPTGEQLAPTPKRKQELLRSLGYAIDVDGQWGPQSEMAWKAYQNHIPPQYWNHNAKRSNLYTAPKRPGIVPTSAPAPVSPGGDVGGNPNNPGNTVGNTPSTNPDLFNSLMQKLQDFKFIDPNSYATSLTNAQFRPQIADAQRALAMTQANGDQSLTDIGNWFDQVIGRQGKALAFNKANAQQASDFVGNAAQGLIGALGGSANAGTAGIGQEALNQQAFVNNLGLAQEGFDKDMGAILAAQKADAKLAQQRAIDQAMFQGNQQLADLYRQRGDTLAKNRGDATNQYLGQLGQYQNLMLGAQMAPGEVQLQNLKIKGQQTANAASSAQLKQFINTYVKAQKGGGAIPSWTALDPGTLGKLQNAAIGAVQNAVLLNHASPQQAYQLVGNLLRNYSQGQWDPARDGNVEAFRRRLLQQLFTRQQFPMVYRNK